MTEFSLKSWLTTRLIFIPFALTIGTLWLWLLAYYKPHLENSENLVLKFPSSLQDVKNLFKLFLLYKEQNFVYVLLLFSSGYIYKQTFAIPGSALLNLLAGAVFGCWPYGVLYCSLLTTVGASNCFLLSRHCGKEFIKHKFPAQISWLQMKLEESEGQLLLLLISLRLFPATPNWLINMVSPIVDIPLHLFAFSVFIGLIPYNFLCMKTGETLSEIESFEEVLTPRRLLVLFSMAAGVLAFSKIAKRQKVKLK